MSVRQSAYDNNYLDPRVVVHLSEACFFWTVPSILAK